MNAALNANASSEPLADLVRQMLHSEKRQVRTVQPKPRPAVPAPRASEALSDPVAMPSLKIVEHNPGGFWRSALPAAVLAVFLYMLLLAV